MMRNDSPPPPMTNPTEKYCVKKHKRWNASTRNLWQEYAPHRERVMSVLSGGVEASQSVGLVGAGNCNDVDLCALHRVFGKIIFVDPDPQAVQKGLKRQGLPQQSTAIFPYPLEVLPNSSLVAAKVDRAVSLCVLSQLFTKESSLLTSSEIQESLATHLLHLGQLANQDCIVISDFAVLNLDYDGIDFEHTSITSRLSSIANMGRFLVGLRTSETDRVLLDHKDLRAMFLPSKLLDIWVWKQGNRNLAVWALLLEKNRLTYN